MLSCILSSFLVLVCIQKYQINGRSFKLDVMKDLKIGSFPCRVMIWPRRFKIASCLAAFLFTDVSNMFVKC